MKHIKTYIINSKEYYLLHAVIGEIGLTYYEVYHNLYRWEAPLGIIRVRKHLYCDKSAALEFMRKTPGYVPLEYYRKRQPLRHSDKLNPLKAAVRKDIRGSSWMIKVSHSEKKLDKNSGIKNSETE